MIARMLRKIAALIMTNKQLPSGVMPHLYVRDQSQVDDYLARWGHTIERRNQHIPEISASDIFRHDVAVTEAAFNNRRPIGRHIDNNSDTLR
jgi:hypothetical protein